jgi:glucokinase
MNILSLDIGGTSIKSALVKKGKLHMMMENSSDGCLGGTHVLRNVMNIIDSYKNFDAVGISTTGQVDYINGCILYENENIPGYAGTPFKKTICEKYNTDFYIENDVNAAALGEACYGAGKGINDFLCLTYGTGIGGAIVINHRIYSGMGGFAGEVGHIITHAEGKKCNCGNFGCYETYASATALISKAQQYNNSLTNGRLIFEEFHKGNAQVASIINEWIDEIIYGLISLIHIFNPSHIIIGGGIMTQNYILDKINEKLPSHTLGGFDNVKVIPAKLGNCAGIYGMASIASNIQY